MHQGSDAMLRIEAGDAQTLILNTPYFTVHSQNPNLQYL